MWKRRNKKTQTHTHTAASSIPERRTVITCVQLGDIIYSNFSNRSIKLILKNSVVHCALSFNYSAWTDAMFWLFWLLALLFFILRTMFDACAGKFYTAHIYPCISVLSIAMRCVVFSNVVFRCLAQPSFHSHSHSRTSFSRQLCLHLYSIVYVWTKFCNLLPLMHVCRQLFSRWMFACCYSKIYTSKGIVASFCESFHDIHRKFLHCLVFSLDSPETQSCLSLDFAKLKFFHISLCILIVHCTMYI